MRTLSLAFVLLFSLPTFADTFACYIKANGKSSIAYEDNYRLKKVRAFADTWACDGAVKGDQIVIKMYEPHLQVDAEIYKKSGPVHLGLDFDIGEAYCSCSLM